MKSVGHVLHRSGGRLLLVHCDASRLPRLYSGVVDRRLRPVGMIVDLFGNIGKPYAAVLCHPGCRVEPGENIYAKG